MSSQEVIKAVSKKLKYYFDVKRREDGFDLSGPDCPRLDHPPLKSRPTLNYSGLHDRPLKHYFHPQDVKVALTKFNVPDGKEGRQKEVKKKVERYVRKYNFVERPREETSLPESFYVTTKKGRRLHPDAPGRRTPHRKSKSPHRGGYPVLRSLPPEYLSRGEATRLINIASKLLVATETIDLKDNKKGKQHEQAAPKAFESHTAILPRLTADDYDASTQGEPEDDSAYHSPLDSSSPSGGMYVTINGEPADNKQVPPWLRKEMQKTDLSDDDRGVDNQWVRPEPPDESSRPKTSMVKRPRSSIRRGHKNGSEKSSASSHSSLHSQSDDGKQDSTAVQTGGELLKNYEPMNEVLSEGEKVTYRVHVFTGKGLGSSTKADIRMVLYGDKGRTEELWLDDSKNHKVLFLRGQEDIFELETFHVGDIKKMAIGHDKKELGFGWFVDKVEVKDPVGKKQFQFLCERWMSSRASDSKTYCHFNVHNSMGYKQRSEKSGSSSEYDPNAIRYEPADSGDDRSVSGHSDSMGSSRTSLATNYSERDKVPAHKERARSRSNSSSSYVSSSSYSTTTSSSSSSSSEDESEQTPPTPIPKEEKETDKPKPPKTVKQSVVPLKTKDDFFDQRPVANDFGSVVDTLSQSTEQDNREDFDTDRPVSSRNPRGKELELLPVEETSSSESEDDGSTVSSGKASKIKIRGKVEGKSDSETESSSEEDDTPRGTTIHQATKSGDFSRVKALIERNPGAKELKDERGWYALHIACQQGHNDIVKWLAANGVNLDSETPTGYTPMHISAMNGHTNCMMVLAAMGTKITAQSVEFQTPLHLAAMSGHLESVKWLVANGARLDVADHLGRMPVDIAQEYEHIEIFNFLKVYQQERKNSHSSLGLHGKSSTNTETAAQSDKRSKTDGGDEGVGSSRGEDEGWSKESRPKTSRSRADQQKSSSNEQDEELMEKRRMYEQQEERKASTGNTFMDSIRAEAEQAESQSQQ